MIFRGSIIAELTSTASAVFTVLFSIIFSVGLVRIIGQAAGGRVDNEAVLQLVALTALTWLPFVLTLTLFIAVLMTLSRAYRASEMVVWFATGQSLLAWVGPVLRFAWPPWLGLPAEWSARLPVAPQLDAGAGNIQSPAWAWWAGGALLVWGMGALAGAIGLIVARTRLSSSLRPVPADAAASHRVRALARAMRLARVPALARCPEAAAPFVFGWRHPVLVLPEEEAADASGPPPQLAAPAGAFELEQAVSLRRGGGARGFAVLTKLVEQGPGFDLYEFVPVS